MPLLEKTYCGHRTPSAGCVVVVVRSDHSAYQLDKAFSLACHSPSGFEWGYTGSGPAQLALAILYDHLKDSPARTKYWAEQRAMQFYQDYRFRVIAHLSHDYWQIKSLDVEEFLKQMELESVRA
jgi:hypothetical protein